MRYANLRSMNLNLLPILQSLLSTRNVTRSAEQLHMSQPAVSDALAKLRVHYTEQAYLQRHDPRGLSARSSNGPVL